MSKLLKTDRRFVVEIVAFMLAIYGISSCVFLNGDDFMYAAFAQTGILNNVANYYFSGNGRFWINILDSALLLFDRFGFIVVLPWIVLALIVLLAKNIQRIMTGYPDSEKEKDLIRMGMVLFCCLDVLCLRETVFWITGMMNYLFPAEIFLWAYLMFQKSRAGEVRGVLRIGYYLLCLLAASGVEQFALMFVGMMTLHHGYDLLKKRKIPAKEWLAYTVSLIGLALLILAPGNFVRVDKHGAEMPPLIDNIWTLLFQDILSTVALPFVIMLAILFLYSSTANRTEIHWGRCIAFLVGIVVSSLINKAIFSVVLLVVLGCLLVYQLFRGNITFTLPVWFLIFVGIGSQFMLLISAVWGYRCMLSLYLVYMLIIGCLLYNADAKQRLFVLASGILASFHPAVTLVFWVAVFWLRRKPTFAKNLATVITCCGSAVALLILLIGYGQNVDTHKMNLQSTTVSENQMIVIQELPDDTYSWYFVPIGEFHEEYYRILHDIPEDINIIYKTTSEPTPIY